MGDEMARVLEEKYPAAWRQFPQFSGSLRDQVVADLAKCHHIPADYDLKKPLEETLKRYFYVYARNQTALKHAQQKSYLQEAIERSTQLVECLDKMSADMEYGIYEHWEDIYPRRDNEQPSKYRWRWRMLEDCRRLTGAARRALRAMPPYTGADEAFHTLIDELIHIYESATNKPITGITKNPYGVEYSQPIVRFVEDCLQLAGIKKTNSAVGQALALAIKRK